VVPHDPGLVVADVPVVHSAAKSCMQDEFSTDGAVEVLAGLPTGGQGSTPLSTETYGRMDALAHAFRKSLASAAASSAAAG
jgi:hypothetical protein